jgi:hypothetical protein
MEVIYVSYNDIIGNPGQHVGDINRFLGNCLDESSMVSAVDINLHRAKTISCG